MLLTFLTQSDGAGLWEPTAVMMKQPRAAIPPTMGAFQWSLVSSRTPHSKLIRTLTAPAT